MDIDLLYISRVNPGTAEIIGYMWVSYAVILFFLFCWEHKYSYLNCLCIQIWDMALLFIFWKVKGCHSMLTPCYLQHWLFFWTWLVCEGHNKNCSLTFIIQDLNPSWTMLKLWHTVINDKCLISIHWFKIWFLLEGYGYPSVILVFTVIQGSSFSVCFHRICHIWFSACCRPSVVEISWNVLCLILCLLQVK